MNESFAGEIPNAMLWEERLKPDICIHGTTTAIMHAVAGG
jgi:hypothetical protein